MKSLIVLSLLLSACGKAPEINVDPDIEIYFQKFTQDTGKEVKDISAMFNPMARPTIAMCIFMGDTRRIEVDRTYWDESSDDDREQIIYHELGHCALYRGHNNALNQYKCQASIMHQYIFAESPCYKMNKLYYFQELVGG